MFRKIIGITGVLVVLGVIVMVALSPRAEGFFPGMPDFLKFWERTETALPVGTGETAGPQIETGTVDAAESVAPGVETVPLVDTLAGDEREAAGDVIIAE